MKGLDIVNALKGFLPLYTDKFTDNTAITTMTRSGSTVSVNAVGSARAVGDVVTVQNSFNPILINNIQDDVPEVGLISFETDEDHDLIYNVDIDKEVTTVRIATADGSYDEVFEIAVVDFVSGVENRLNFIVKKGTASAPTGTPDAFVMSGSLFFGYNGVHTVTTVTDVDNFEFELPVDKTPGSPAFGDNMVANSGYRISRAVSFENAQKAYEAQNEDDYWLFVVLRATDANNDRNNNSIDTATTLSAGDDFRQNIIKGFDAYAFIPNKGTSNDDVTGGRVRDIAEGLEVPIYRSVLSLEFPEDLACPGTQVLTFDGSSQRFFSGPYLAHRYGFQRPVEITYQDTTQIIDNSVAFRDIFNNIRNQFAPDPVEGQEVIAKIDLDQEPIVAP